MLKILNYKHLLFFLIIVLQMVIYNYPYIAKIEPRTVHAWRQFDCLSFAQSFYHDRGTLVEPCVNNLGSTGTGKAASDFPIVQFIIGNIWKITGVQTIIYRLVNLAFLIFGLFYIYKLFLQEFKNKIFAACFAALIFTSANLSYYGISTISDIQAFSLSMIGFYFFYNWVKIKNNRHFILFILIFSLAGLLKASSAIVYLLCLSYLIFDGIENKKVKAELFNKQNLIKCFLLFLPFLLWLAWFVYARNYNIKNKSSFFLVGTLPIWDLQQQRINDNFNSLIYNLLPQILNPLILLAVFVFIIRNSFLNLKKHFSASLMLIGCVFVFILYILLFFDAFDVHDYYLINTTGIFVIALFFIFKIIYDRYVINNFKVVWSVLIIMLLYNTYTSGIKTWKKINCNVNNIENSIVFNAFEQKNFFWIYWHDRQHYKALEDKALDIKKIGVLGSDTIFCLGDETINRSLYLLDRVGYTSFNTDVEKAVTFVGEHKNIKFIFLINPTLKKNPKLISLFNNKIFEKETLSIYKIK
jgi:hypothetical protein